MIQFSYITAGIIAAVVLAAMIVIPLIVKSKIESHFASVLAQATLELKETENKLAIVQLYNSAWFAREQALYKKEIHDKYFDENGKRKLWVDDYRWGWEDCPELHEPINLENEMMKTLSNTETEYRAVRVISEYVPKTIRALVDTKDGANAFNSEKDSNTFRHLLGKYNIDISPY